MIAASYLQQPSNFSNRQTAPWETNNGSSLTGSESGSDDSSKNRRRSHRPRGCRGGGSRRARKERRELQFLTEKQPTPIQALKPSNQFLPSVFCQGSDLVLPGLQESSSFSSSGSSEGSDTYLHMNSKTSEFNILPSMPTGRPSNSCDSRSNYRGMSASLNALPPLPSATASTTFQHATVQTAYTNMYTNNVNTHDAAPITLNTYRNSGNVYVDPATLNPTAESFAYSSGNSNNNNYNAHNMSNSNYNAHSMSNNNNYNAYNMSNSNNNSSSGNNNHSAYNSNNSNNISSNNNYNAHNNSNDNISSSNNNRSNNNSSSSSSNISNCNVHNRNNNNNDACNSNVNNYVNNSYHTTERIKIQQEMLAGGGSLFATSPRSFLLGKKKGPTYCF